jgi:hypothetical protein
MQLLWGSEGIPRVEGKCKRRRIQSKLRRDGSEILCHKTIINNDLRK